MPILLRLHRITVLICTSLIFNFISTGVAAAQDPNSALSPAADNALASAGGGPSWGDGPVQDLKGNPVAGSYDSTKDEITLNSTEIRRLIGDGGMDCPDFLEAFLEELVRHELRHRNSNCTTQTTKKDRFCLHFAQFVADYSDACVRAGMARTAYCAALEAYGDCVFEGTCISLTLS